MSLDKLLFSTIGDPMIPIVKVGLPPRETLMPELEAVLYSGQIGEGEQVYAFEREFGRVFGLPNALAMSSGTAALHAALTLAGVGPGDEVISTAMTAEPTNTVITQVGARPVWADVHPDTGNVDPSSIADRITDRTRAIMVVHYAGYPVELNAIAAIARAHDLPVIEDCAHALGARYDGKPIGTIGDYGIFSLQAIKHMTTVDGGILTIRDAARIREAKRFRWFGLERGVDRQATNIESQGYKYNLTNVAATIGLGQLRVIEARIAAHIRNAERMNAAFAGAEAVQPARIATSAEPSYWLYTLLCDDDEAVVQRLASIAVASKLHKRNDLHALFATARRPLPGLDAFQRRMLHLPCGWWVDDDDCDRIIDAVLNGGSQ